MFFLQYVCTISKYTFTMRRDYVKGDSHPNDKERCRYMLKAKSIIFGGAIFVILLIASFWYSNNQGYLSTKSKIKEELNNHYDTEVKVENTNYLNNGITNIGEWVVEYRVVSDASCKNYRAWFSKEEVSLGDIEYVGSCN